GRVMHLLEKRLEQVARPMPALLGLRQIAGPRQGQPLIVERVGELFLVARTGGEVGHQLLEENKRLLLHALRLFVLLLLYAQEALILKRDGKIVLINGPLLLLFSQPCQMLDCLPIIPIRLSRPTVLLVQDAAVYECASQVMAAVEFVELSAVQSSQKVH